MSWDEAAQAYLESIGLSTPTASLIYSLAALSCCWILLWFLWRKRVFISLSRSDAAGLRCQSNCQRMSRSMPADSNCNKELCGCAAVN
jgi:hypothetical protein